MHATLYHLVICSTQIDISNRNEKWVFTLRSSLSMKRKRPAKVDADVSDLSDELSDEISEEHCHVKRRPKINESESTPDQWIDKYSPRTVQLVCMNPQKVKQIQKGLELLFNGDKRLLIVSGPAGSSKSTAVTQLAGQILGMPGVDAVISYEEVSGAEAEFDDWLQGVRYRGGSSIRVILVEELPNVFHRGTLNRFRSALLLWVCDTRPVPPLVLCLTEVDDVDGGGLAVDSLLPRWMMSHSAVESIKVNKIAARYLRKTMAEVVAKESRPGGGLCLVDRRMVDTFVETMMDVGDIRATIANLQTWSRLGRLVEAAKMFRREDGLELFHSLGKIMYGSTKDESDESTLNHVLTLYGDLLLLESSLLENYHMYKNGNFAVSGACSILRLLGDGDIMKMPEISIRAVRNTFASTPRDGSIRRDKVRFPRQYRVMGRARVTGAQLADYRRFIGNMRVSASDINLIDGYYLPQIYNSFRYKYITGSRSRYRYRRIGGEIGLSGDEDKRPLMFGDGEEADNGDEMDQFLWEIRQKQMGENGDDSDDEGELSDPIDDSDHITSDVRLTGALEAMLEDDSDDDSDPDTRNNNLQNASDNNDDDSLLSDSELDLLLSQGIIRNG